MTETPRDAVGRRLAAAEGWQTLEGAPDPKQNREQWAAFFAICKMTHDTFATEPGQRLLQHLVTTFVARPIVHPNDTQFAAGIRQGQAEVVLQILQQVELAKRGTP